VVLINFFSLLLKNFCYSKSTHNNFYKKHLSKTRYALSLPRFANTKQTPLKTTKSSGPTSLDSMGIFIAVLFFPWGQSNYPFNGIIFSTRNKFVNFENFRKIDFFKCLNLPSLNFQQLPLCHKITLQKRGSFQSLCDVSKNKC
jgi:hypothetical protein